MPAVLSEASGFDGNATPNLDLLLNELDKDGRGFVTRDEWRSGCRKDPRRLGLVGYLFGGRKQNRGILDKVDKVDKVDKPEKDKPESSALQRVLTDIQRHLAPKNGPLTSPRTPSRHAGFRDVEQTPMTLPSAVQYEPLPMRSPSSATEAAPGGSPASQVCCACCGLLWVLWELVIVAY